MNQLVRALASIAAPSRRGAKPAKPKAKPGRRQSRALARRPNTVNNPAWGRSLPAAYASHVRPRFNFDTRDATGCRVSGCDLVYPVPATVTSSGDYLFTIIPANPAYWTGTRISQIAPAYMNYRPLRMTFSYIPQVAVTQAGTVVMGTLWNGSAGSVDLQQTLFTSNGGCLTQCYVPCDTTIRLGSNLQQNLFTLNGAMGPDTLPFLFVAALRGASVIPGYFYVTYTFEFKNPIGAAWTYTRSSVSTGAPSAQSLPNTSAVLLGTSGIYGPGTVFDLEGENLYYRGTPVTIDPNTPYQLFSNGQTEGVEAAYLTLADAKKRQFLVASYRVGTTDGPTGELTSLAYQTTLPGTPYVNVSARTPGYTWRISSTSGTGLYAPVASADVYFFYAQDGTFLFRLTPSGSTINGFAPTQALPVAAIVSDDAPTLTSPAVQTGLDVDTADRE